MFESLLPASAPATLKLCSNREFPPTSAGEAGSHASYGFLGLRLTAGPWKGRRERAAGPLGYPCIQALPGMETEPVSLGRLHLWLFVLCLSLELGPAVTSLSKNRGWEDKRSIGTRATCPQEKENEESQKGQGRMTSQLCIYPQPDPTDGGECRSMLSITD